MMSQTAEPDCALDAGALDRLHELDPDGRSGVVRRVLSAYESSVVRLLGALRDVGGLPPADAARLVFETAHTLKSSSKSVGALRFAGVCEDVEHSARVTGQALPHDVRRLLDEGGSALVAVRDVLGH